MEMSPQIIMYNSIYNQLKDINEKIVNEKIVFSEDELYTRYSIGALAVKNFDLEHDEYAQKLSDAYGGAFDFYEMPEN